MNEQGPQIKRRDIWVDLPEEYEGFRMLVWVNAPTSLWRQVDATQDEGKIQGALQQIISAHNGWIDYEGQPYPQPDKPEFWKGIPTELAACMIVAAKNAAKILPNSMARTKPR